MVTALYVASAEPEAGKSTAALGLLDQLSRRLGSIAVFRPFIRCHDEQDPLFETLLSQGASQRSRDVKGVSYDEVHEDPNTALSTIVDRFHTLKQGHDGVLVIGSDFTDVVQPAELEFNAQIAANIGAPVTLVVSGTNRTPDEVAEVADLAGREVEANHAHLFMVLVNRVPVDQLQAVCDAVTQHLAARSARHGRTDTAMVDALPDEPILGAPTVGQFQAALGATMVAGDEAMLEQESTALIVAAMTMPHVLERLCEGGTVLVPGDRGDVVLGALSAHASQTFPNLSAIILNGGFSLDPPVERLLAGVPSRLPVLMTSEGTYATTTALNAVRGVITPDATRKIELALQLFRTNVDGEEVLNRLDLTTSEVVTPIMFEHSLTDTARAPRMRIVLPEGTEERILRAASVLLTREVADLTLLGEPDEVRRQAAAFGVDLDGAQVISPQDPELVEEFAVEYARLRAHRGVTLDAARDRVVDVSYFGTMLVVTGRADGMVSGAVHTTAHTIRPAIELLRDPSTGVKTVSSVFFMCLPERVLVFGDCAIVPEPTDTQLADIAIASAATATQFGVTPRIAMLSYSTGSSGTGDNVDKVRKATELVRERAPELVVEGPLQYDAAVDPSVAATKLPGSAVAGKATVLIFPDLNTGNNTYKAVQRSANAVAIGPVMQGLTRPVNDLSRGATIYDIVNTVALTAVQAQHLKHLQG